MSVTFFMHINNHTNKSRAFQKSKKAKSSYTVAGILDGNNIQFGVAKCVPTDQFSKAVGRQFALERAKTAITVEIPPVIVERKEIGKYFIAKAKKLANKL